MALFKVDVKNDKGEVLEMTFTSENAREEFVFYCLDKGIDYQVTHAYGYESYNMRNIEKAYETVEMWVVK